MRWEDRTLLVGRTRSGKSRLARALAESVKRHTRVQETGRAGTMLILDPAGSTLCNLPGSVTIRDPRLLDAALERCTQFRVIRLAPTNPFDLGVWNAAYEWAWDQAPVWVWCDELRIILPARRAPLAGLRYLVAGAKGMRGHLGCNTRPREMDPELLGSASHIAAFEMSNPDDRDRIAGAVGMSPRDFTAAADRLDGRRKEFLWWSAGGQLRHCEPLPAP